MMTPIIIFIRGLPNMPILSPFSLSFFFFSFIPFFLCRLRLAAINIHPRLTRVLQT